MSYKSSIIFLRHVYVYCRRELDVFDRTSGATFANFCFPHLLRKGLGDKLEVHTWSWSYHRRKRGMRYRRLEGIQNESALRLKDRGGFEPSSLFTAINPRKGDFSSWVFFFFLFCCVNDKPLKTYQTRHKDKGRLFYFEYIELSRDLFLIICRR